MTKIARFTGNLQPFGISATGTKRTVFGDVTQSDTLDANVNADFLVGWESGLDGNGFPPQQFFTAIGFTATQISAYLHQMGIAEYDSAQEYHDGSLTNVAGVIYSSLTDTNIGNDPLTDTVNWKNTSGITAGAISGLVMSNGTDTDHDIDVTIGSARGTDDNVDLVLSSALTKRVDATWAVGDNAGGLFSGSVANDTWYAVHLIQKDSDGSIDVGFDTSETAANIPAGYTAYRRIGWVLTDGSANIINFKDRELAGGAVKREYNEYITDLNLVNNTNYTRSVTIVSCPVNSIGQFGLYLEEPASTGAVAWVASTDLVDFAPTTTNSDLVADATGGGANIDKEIFVSSSNQIAFRLTATSAINFFVVMTLGYTDRRSL